MKELVEVTEAVEILSRTPALLDLWLVGLSAPWLGADEGEGTYDPVDVVAHLVHNEETDWLPRLEIMSSMAMPNRSRRSIARSSAHASRTGRSSGSSRVSRQRGADRKSVV